MLIWNKIRKFESINMLIHNLQIWMFYSNGRETFQISEKENKVLIDILYNILLYPFL